MALTPGTRLGPYEIRESLGEGGMGEVYRARDVRLERDVAVKTIKGPFSERFAREARAISSLNHPHICTLHDVGEHEGGGYLVLEYLEGKPVAGPLPVEQAIAYGIQICEALHAAHRKGIVHRDLKPANILVTKQGVKLLDFGLAKLLAPDSDAGATDVGEQATVAPLTGAHTVVGTPQYMAPEQIEGRAVDARTDIFAFGGVLYELLTGRRAFDGATPSSVMAAILAAKPRPLAELVPLAPPALDRIVTRCLEKDPDDRWQSARDVGAELQWVAEGGSKVGLPEVVTGRRRIREAIAWTACALATVVAVGFAVAWLQRAPQPAAVVRFQLPVPPNVTSPGFPVVSPDGRHVAFSGSSDGRRLIWIHSLDAVDARSLPGTEGAQKLFWSPDSRFVAFVADHKLKKVDIAGGAPQVIADTRNGADGSWSPEGVILLDAFITDPLRRVPAGGGVWQPVVLEDGKPDGTPGTGWPDFLPDGKRFLYLQNDGSPEARLMVGSIESMERKELLRTTTNAQYAAPGYLLFVREGTLVAQTFDARSVTLQGDPMPIAEGLSGGNAASGSFSASQNGVLAYRRPDDLRSARLLWIDRRAQEQAAIEGVAEYGDAALSPDGARFVYSLVAGSNADLWIRDVARGVSSRFTFDEAPAVSPHWSPDGRRIVYTSRGNARGDLFVKEASGTREAEPLLVNDDDKVVSDWSRDGRHILFNRRADRITSWDIWALPLDGDRTPFPVIQTRFIERGAVFSPNGRYIAYNSNESGRLQIYVQEFPDARNKWQVSTNGGVQPFWRADGRELFYFSGNGIWAVPVETGATFTAGTPVELFEAAFAPGALTTLPVSAGEPPVSIRAAFQPTADGQRFLVRAPPLVEAPQPVSVVLNWHAALRR